MRSPGRIADEDCYGLNISGLQCAAWLLLTMLVITPLTVDLFAWNTKRELKNLISTTQY